MKYAIVATQCRAARGLLNWSRQELANASGVPSRTIADFELENTAPRSATTDRLASALDAAGVEFIAENGGGPGVRLKKPGWQLNQDGESVRSNIELHYRPRRE